MSYKVCSSALSLYPLRDVMPGILRFSTVGVLGVLIGFIYFLNASLCLYWIFRQRREASKGDSSAAKYAIFPTYIPVLVASAGADVYVGLLSLFVAIDTNTANAWEGTSLLALGIAFQAFVLDGLAISLMQYGCGRAALKRAAWLALGWACASFSVMFVRYRLGPTPAGLAAQLVWEGTLMFFYLSLWLAPIHWVYRRPAAVCYGAYFAVFRGSLLVSALLASFVPSEYAEEAGDCFYEIMFVLMFALCKPYLVYYTLRMDSAWWQGLPLGPVTLAGRLRRKMRRLGFGGTSSPDRTREYAPPPLAEPRSPLAGVEVGQAEARELADAVDHVDSIGAVKLVNFAYISLRRRDPLLGAGSFSKVYRARYKDRPVALKLLFTLDINPEVIRRCCNEAQILSEIRHKHVVQCYGITVLPPSMGIVLEVCEFGSLADVIRGVDVEGRRKPPLQLTHADRMYLAHGCAQGVLALHAHSSRLCHRDIKSFNFLVTEQLVVKIADLELGGQFRDRRENHYRGSSEKLRGRRSDSDRDHIKDSSDYVASSSVSPARDLSNKGNCTLHDREDTMGTSREELDSLANTWKWTTGLQGNEDTGVDWSTEDGHSSNRFESLQAPVTEDDDENCKVTDEVNVCSDEESSSFGWCFACCCNLLYCSCCGHQKEQGNTYGLVGNKDRVNDEGSISENDRERDSGESSEVSRNGKGDRDRVAQIEPGAQMALSGNSVSSRSRGLFLYSSAQDDDLQTISTWQPPEVLLRSEYSQASDIYSLCMVLWEVVASAPSSSMLAIGNGGNALPSDVMGTPFCEFVHLGEDEVRKQILIGARPALPLSQDCPEILGNLIKQGWTVDPLCRPTAFDLVSVTHSCWLDSIHSIVREKASLLELSPLLERHSMVSKVGANSARDSDVSLDPRRWSRPRSAPTTPFSPNLPAATISTISTISSVASLQNDPVWTVLDKRPSSGSIVIMSSLPPFIVLHVTKRFTQLFGFMDAEALYSDLGLLDGPQTDKLLRLRMLTECAEHGVPRHFVLKLYRKDNMLLSLSVHLFPLFDETQTPSLSPQKLSTYDSPGASSQSVESWPRMDSFKEKARDNVRDEEQSEWSPQPISKRVSYIVAELNSL